MKKIMLVEDDNNLREIYEARLAAEGYAIVSAQDGEAALALAAKERPDLVITDVMMPKISGFEMLDILRNTENLKDVKVIMLTALGQAEDSARAGSLGADRYLVKSQVTLEDIVKATHEVLDAPAAGQPTDYPAAAQDAAGGQADEGDAPTVKEAMPWHTAEAGETSEATTPEGQVPVAEPQPDATATPETEVSEPSTADTPPPTEAITIPVSTPESDSAESNSQSINVVEPPQPDLELPAVPDDSAAAPAEPTIPVSDNGASEDTSSAPETPEVAPQDSPDVPPMATSDTPTDSPAPASTDTTQSSDADVDASTTLVTDIVDSNTTEPTDAPAPVDTTETTPDVAHPAQEAAEAVAPTAAEEEAVMRSQIDQFLQNTDAATSAPQAADSSDDSQAPVETPDSSEEGTSPDSQTTPEAFSDNDSDQSQESGTESAEENSNQDSQEGEPTPETAQGPTEESDTEYDKDASTPDMGQLAVHEPEATRPTEETDAEYEKDASSPDLGQLSVQPEDAQPGTDNADEASDNAAQPGNYEQPPVPPAGEEPQAFTASDQIVSDAVNDMMGNTTNPQSSEVAMPQTPSQTGYDGQVPTSDTTTPAPADVQPPPPADDTYRGYGGSQKRVISPLGTSDKPDIHQLLAVEEAKASAGQVAASQQLPVSGQPQNPPQPPAGPAGNQPNDPNSISL